MNSTTRTLTARRNRTAAVQRTVQDRLAARLEANEPARVVRPRGPIASMIVPDELVLRLPEYHEDGFMVFIGEDATVLVEERVTNLDHLLHTGGVKARTGHFPVEDGIVVMPHTGSLASPTYPGRNGEAQMAWRLVHDTLVNA